MNSTGYHIYGGKAAMEIAPILTKSKQIPTVMIDIAPRAANGGHALWGNKMQIQPTPQELPTIAALFMGYIKKARIVRDNRFIQFEDQGSNLYLTAITGQDERLALPISPADRFHAGAVIMQQVEKQYPGASPGILLSILRSSYIKAAPTE